MKLLFLTLTVLILNITCGKNVQKIKESLMNKSNGKLEYLYTKDPPKSLKFKGIPLVSQEIKIEKILSKNSLNNNVDILTSRKVLVAAPVLESKVDNIDELVFSTEFKIDDQVSSGQEIATVTYAYNGRYEQLYSPCNGIVLEILNPGLITFKDTFYKIQCNKKSDYSIVQKVIDSNIDYKVIKNRNTRNSKNASLNSIKTDNENNIRNTLDKDVDFTLSDTDYPIDDVNTNDIDINDIDDTYDLQSFQNDLSNDQRLAQYTTYSDNFDDINSSDTSDSELSNDELINIYQFELDHSDSNSPVNSNNSSETKKEQNFSIMTNLIDKLKELWNSVSFRYFISVSIVIILVVILIYYLVIRWRSSQYMPLHQRV